MGGIVLAEYEGYLMVFIDNKVYLADSNEDYSYFASCVPSCFYNLGIKNEAKGINAPLHNRKFDVDEEEYNLLAPLSAKVLVSATRRQMTYLNPQRFKNATEEINNAKSIQDLVFFIVF